MQAMSRTGVGFSGGGIRSAAFCSGVLRRLLQRQVKVDCLSCVSGGGYTGTAYLDWKYRNGQKDHPKWHQEFFEHMRKRAGYFCNWQNPIVGVIDALSTFALIALVSVIFPVIIWMSYACPLAYLVDFLVGDLLRAEPCKEDPLTHECVEKDPDAAKRGILFASLLASSVLSFIVANISPWGKTLFNFIFISLLVILGLFALPWGIHTVLENSPAWIKPLIFVLAAVVWFVFPVLRRQAAIVMVVYIYVIVIHARVYKHFLLGFDYSDYTFNVLVWVSGILLCLVPFIGSIQQRLMHVFNRWRLQKAFYTPQSVGATGCTGIGCHDLILGYPWFISTKTKILSLADFENVSPFYICNTTVNDWKRTPDDEESFELLTLTPREVRRLDSPYEEDVFMDKLEPEDIRLSEAMAISAAALAPRMGGISGEGKDVTTDLKIILGVAMGASILSDPRKDRRRNICLQFVPFMMETIRALPLIAFPVVYFLEGDEMWVTIGVLSYFGILLFYSAMAMIPTGAEKPGLLEKIIRWFLVNVPYIRYIRNMTGVVNTGPSPPPILSVSDGGHTENLGLLSLLQLRLPKIVIANGSEIQSDAEYGTALLDSLQKGREKLKCSFTGLDGRDIIEDLRANFVDKSPGQQPRSYKFKVTYYSLDPDEGVEKKAGEGEILLIAPRHPTKGVQTKEHVTWKDALHDINVDLEAGQWGTGPELDAAEVDRLTFCCCECCHSMCCRRVSHWCCGTFPGHLSANQFFTPALFSAYHREGYRACVEAEAVEFLSA